MVVLSHRMVLPLTALPLASYSMYCRTNESLAKLSYHTCLLPGIDRLPDIFHSYVGIPRRCQCLLVISFFRA